MKRGLTEEYESLIKIYRHYIEEPMYEFTTEEKELEEDVKEMKKYFLKEEEMEVKEEERMIFYFEEEKKLVEHVQNNWGKEDFMKDLFVYFDEAIFL